jgi:hypothetical protein
MDPVVLFFARLMPEPLTLWPDTRTHVVILVIILLLAWAASPGEGFPLTMLSGLASLAVRALLAGGEQPGLPGEA